jgi:tripartite-type tricarboxylate transporter receptor subunit TctC
MVDVMHIPMRPTRRGAPAAVAALLLVLSSGFGAANAAYPERPIRIVVPFTPGGAVDVVARIVAPKLGDQLNQSIVIENKGGAGGALGATAVAQAAPDGYTLLLGTGSTHGTNPSVYTRLSYDPVRDFIPIVLVTSSPMVLDVNPTVPARSVQDLIALMKARPDEISFGSYGPGSINHLAAELFNAMAGTRSGHVPYRGAAPMLTDLIAGRVAYAFDGIATSIGYGQAGTIRVLGVAGVKRASILPDAPTIAESALPGFDAGSWFGLFAPAGTPQAIVDMLNTKANAALAAPGVKESLEKIGFEVEGGDAKVLAERVKTEMQKWVAIVREKNIHIDQ